MDNVCYIFHFVFFFLLAEVQASGKMTILLVNYRNPKHTVFNGDCCDNLNFCSWNECDNLFKFCAASLGSTVACSLGGQLSTGILGDDDFYFPGQGGNLGGGLTNPITFSFQEWKGVSVVIEVWDDDGGFIVGKLADFVDKYTLVETNAPDSNLSSSRPRDKKLCGKRSCTNVKIRVYCDDNYLIPGCTEYCLPHNSDEEGHYSCDYDHGRKVCKEGWYDALSNCTKKKKECTPRNDTIGGHYGCNPENGEKICLSGWAGINCTEVYVSYSVSPQVSTKDINQDVQTTLMHQTTTWKPAMSSSTTNPFDKHRIPSTSALLSSSISIGYHKESLDISLGLVSTSTRRPPSTLKAEFKSTSKNTETIVLPSTLLYSSHPASSHPASKLHTLIAVTKKVSKETTSYNLESSFSSSLKESSSINLHRTSSLRFTFSKKTTLPEALSRYMTSSRRVQHSTRQILIDFTSAAAQSSLALYMSSSAKPTTSTVPTTEWKDLLTLNVIPGKNWTSDVKDKLKSVITDQVNKFCTAQPLSCNIDPEMILNRTDLFNLSGVFIAVKNGSSDVVSVSVRVKLPSSIPGLSGGGFLPSVIPKQIITTNKNTIEKHTGFKVSLEPPTSPITTTTKPTLRPTTTTSTVINTPTSTLFPIIWNTWVYIVGSCVVLLILLGAALCFKFKINRKNKVHSLSDKKGTLTQEDDDDDDDDEEEEMICLSESQLLAQVPKNNSLKLKSQDTVLRARSSSVNSDKSVLYSPFTPEYTST